MFSRTRTILFPSTLTLRVAAGDIRTGNIARETQVSLTDDGLRGALRAALGAYPSKARFVVPEEYLYLTQIEIPKVDAVRTRLVRTIGTVFPEALSDLAWDFEVVAEHDGQATVEVSGVTKDFGALLAEAFSGSKVRLEAVIPESYALAHALPSDEAVLFIHQRGTGTILCLAAGHRVVSSLILDHEPSQVECAEFIEYGKTRKQFVAEKVLLSGVSSTTQEISFGDLPVVSLDAPLDPIQGALRINLSSERDAERLDLPLRAYREPWYRRLFHSK